ncbi:6-carboxytetrahydropterin synthase [Arachidicoccus ginsenosidivorans]|jgi:6-pyruvoyltetrahydropterin/6-carboxytetrahydropterin synthase|uniref:6-carboxy-5,6,7,8-tetrahydropterin synthase n=1 Tax=Arachidicoccus ginsenosidivorans TaxID=496057 RepID=A0A5B8VMI7_9BACT|nr:6-carboxytetrahydropterin synthase [Arachidicoccus ginsenosidivorans]QEC71806.1 6-carboxytetrahydropterin synthase [Arachidicoccus ginsenosidivorans]
MGQEKVAVFRKAHFNAAHRLHVESWDEQHNNEVFGKCNNPHFHGHNYELIVKVTGPVDPVTGFVVDLKLLNDVIQAEIIQRFDHKNLNLDTQEFKNLIPTAENIAIVIYQILRQKLDLALELQIRLYETERNFVEFPVA